MLTLISLAFSKSSQIGPSFSNHLKIACEELSREKWNPATENVTSCSISSWCWAPLTKPWIHPSFQLFTVYGSRLRAQVRGAAEGLPVLQLPTHGDGAGRPHGGIREQNESEHVRGACRALRVRCLRRLRTRPSPPVAQGEKICSHPCAAGLERQRQTNKIRLNVATPPGGHFRRACCQQSVSLSENRSD